MWVLQVIFVTNMPSSPELPSCISYENAELCCSNNNKDDDDNFLLGNKLNALCTKVYNSHSYGEGVGD